MTNEDGYARCGDLDESIAALTASAGFVLASFYGDDLYESSYGLGSPIGSPRI